MHFNNPFLFYLGGRVHEGEILCIMFFKVLGSI